MCGEGGGLFFRSDRLSAGQTYDFVPELPVHTNLGETAIIQRYGALYGALNAYFES